MKHDKNRSRRDFLKSTGAATAAGLACLGGSLTPGGSDAAEPPASKPRRPLRLALASYTLRKFDLDQTLAMTKRVGLDAICLKSFHLPLNSSPEQIAAAVAKVKEAGITLYGGGVIGMKNPEQVDLAFEYAKAAGMVKIIGAPSVEMLPLVNEKVRQYDIEVCIHNHGPGDSHFPTPQSGYEKIKQFDTRIGFCHDIGHTKRYGRDPVTETRNCADRILDIHFKDVTEAAKQGHSTPCGRGIMDLPGMIRALIDIDYKGYVSFEYEEHPGDVSVYFPEAVDGWQVGLGAGWV